jgi:hypothetical protein
MRPTRRDRKKANACISSGMRQFDGSQWLEASDLAALAGGTVTTWTARQGVSPTQGAAAKRPTMNGSTGCVVFDGVDDCLVGDCGVGGSPTATCIVFAEKITSGAGAVILEHTTQHYDRDGLMMAQLNASNANWQSIGSTTLSTYRNSEQSAPRGVNGGAMNRTPNPDTILSIYNGGIDDGAYGRQVDSTGNFAASSSYIGSRNNGASLRFNKGIACILVFRELLNYEQMCAVAAKYRKVWRF